MKIDIIVDGKVYFANPYIGDSPCHECKLSDLCSDFPTHPCRLYGEGVNVIFVNNDKDIEPLKPVRGDNPNLVPKPVRGDKIKIVHVVCTNHRLKYKIGDILEVVSSHRSGDNNRIGDRIFVKVRNGKGGYAFINSWHYRWIIENKT